MTDSVAKNAIRRPGDVKIDEVVIITASGKAQTVTPQVMSIEIYEDIFSSFITGKIVIRDVQDLINFLPLVGEEVVRFKVITPSLPAKDGYSGEFYIYKMDDRVKIGDKQYMYVLHFITKDAITDLNKKISRAYSGKVSDIAVKVLTATGGFETKKEVNVEETSNTLKYVSNFWSPVKNMQYLCENAVNMNGSPSYLFFENKYGFHFISFETLYRTAPISQRFRWDNYTATPQPTGGSTTNLDADYQRIIELSTPETFDYIERVRSGLYGSEIIYMDLLTKQYVHTSYVPDFDKDGAHLNKYPLWSSAAPVRPKALLIHEHQYYNNFDGYDVTSNTKTIQKRKSLLAQAEGHKVIITVFGRTDYSAGQRVYLEIPRAAQIGEKETETIDKIMSGDYLIAAIKHSINRETHECVMELIKDSYMVNLDDRK